MVLFGIQHLELYLLLLGFLFGERNKKMKKWIKVNEYYHGDGSTRLTYINAKKIIALWRDENLTKVYFNHDSILYAKETPEEIIKLMEGNKKK